MFGDVFSWIGNAATNAWDWSSKAVKTGFEFAWALPARAAEEQAKLAERQLRETGKTIRTGQELASFQQKWLTGLVSPQNLIVIGLVALVIVLISKK